MSCFTFIAGILLDCLVLYDLLCMEIIEYRYFGDCDFSILQKQQSFLYQRRFWGISKPDSWHSFSLEEPLIAPVFAKGALY